MKKVWKVGKYVLASLAVLTIVLVVHLVMVIKPVPNATMQISRIDFNKSLNDAEAADIIASIKKVESVKFTSVNKEEGFLIYSHDNTKVDANEAYRTFKNTYSGNALKYVAIASAETGCPMQIKNTVASRFISGIQTLIN